VTIAIVVLSMVTAGSLLVAIISARNAARIYKICDECLNRITQSQIDKCDRLERREAEMKAMKAMKN